uniref:UPF0496 protein At3g19330 n=1 Tax=Anthurium amnicola TaxID=1678845 RepID=A0A1D1Y9D9_9ARAE
MRCFGFLSTSSSPQVASTGAADCPPPSSAAVSEVGEHRHPPSGGDTPRSGRSDAASPTTFNLLASEYTLALHTHSYAEIWSKIHPPSPSDGDARLEVEVVRGSASASASSSSSSHLVGEVLRPDRGSVDEALRGARTGRLTRLVSDYFDGSEHSSRLCIRLTRCVHRAQAIYAPLFDLLDVLQSPPNTPVSASSASSPSHRHHRLSQDQCDSAFHAFQVFDANDNPFPAPGSAEDGAGGFQGMRSCFAHLRQQLDRRARRVRARARLLRRATAGSALCLVGTAVGVAVCGLIVAVHALPALAAAAPPLLGFLRRPGDPLAARRRRLREHIAQLEAASKGTFVLNNQLDTIERLVARLHATVESDKVLVRLVLSRGRPDRYPIEEVVRQLRRNHQGFLDQLRALEEHVCLCFAAINRARSLLLHQIQPPPS